MSYLPVTAVAIGLISPAVDTSVSATIVSTASGVSVSVTFKPEGVCTHLAVPPVRTEHSNSFAGKPGSVSVVSVELRMCK